MDIEVYLSGEPVPALYDIYMDEEGTIYGMNPPANELHDLIQVVAEQTFEGLTPDQHNAVRFLAIMNEAENVYLYRHKSHCKVNALYLTRDRR